MYMNCAILHSNESVTRKFESFISKIPFLTLDGIYKEPAKALKEYYENKVNLYFIGIEDTEDEVNGMEFSKLLSPSTRVIFISESDRYAAECFRLDALDYLLTTDMSFYIFFESVNKASRWFSLQEPKLKAITTEKMSADFPEVISVKSNNRIMLVDLPNILYIESLGDYVKIFTRNMEKPILSLCSMKYMEGKLPATDFLRIHRSFIIRKECIRTIGNNTITLDKRELPVGDTYRNQFKSYLSLLQVI